ncbi:MAG: phage portal protein [Bacteroidales bacterium]|nr:phage portal protein [Bacteroidales bacterium]
MGIFSRKKDTQGAIEERKESLGALLFSQGGGFGNSTALKLSAFYCGVNQISNAVAMLPIQIVNYDSDEKRPIQHPLWKVLNLSPDEKYNHFNVFKMAIESVIIKGEAFFLIERDAKLNVKALHYINADFVSPTLMPDGSVKYIVTGFKEAVDAINMIHLWMHVDDQFNGISLLRYAYNTLKGAYDAEASAAKFYRGGAGLNGILKANATLTNEQKRQIRESWNQAFSNDGNGIAVLPAGLDYQSVQISPEDASLIDNREFNIVEIARFLNISPIKLFQLDEVSYSSMESTELYFLSDTVAPYCNMIEEEFNRKLVKPSEVGKVGVSFDFSAALSTNRQAEGEYYRMMITNGIMTINEVRGRLGLPKMQEKAGDSHFVQISYGTAEDIAEGKYIKQQGQTQNTEQDKKVSNKGE